MDSGFRKNGILRGRLNTLADLKAGLNLVIEAKKGGESFRMWRLHGLQD
jgi:hypothetical protein